MISKSDIFSHFDFLTFFWLQPKLKYLGKFGFRETSQKRMDTKCKRSVKSKLGWKQVLLFFIDLSINFLLGLGLRVRTFKFKMTPIWKAPKVLQPIWKIRNNV